QAKVSDQESKLDTLKEQYAERSEVVVDAKLELASLKNQLKQNKSWLDDVAPRPNPLADTLQANIAQVDGEIRGIQAQRAHLKSELEQFKGTVESMGVWETQLAAKQREREEAEKQWLSLEDKRRDLEIRDKAHPTLVRPIETALVPPDPVRPKKAANIMLSIALATCLGLAT